MNAVIIKNDLISDNKTAAVIGRAGKDVDTGPGNPHISRKLKGKIALPGCSSQVDALDNGGGLPTELAEVRETPPLPEKDIHRQSGTPLGRDGFSGIGFGEGKGAGSADLSRIPVCSGFQDSGFI
ncbi:unnamed protein product, partial [marine sediment metagenome]